MPNLTLKIDDRLLKSARKIAIDKETTLTNLIRGYLENLVRREQESKENVISKLEECFSNDDIVVGKITWKRDDLHAR